MKDISVVMIASNEEKIIKKSLQAVNWAKEIVVVLDEKSKDQTEKIARDSKANVFINKWKGYANQKNFAINKATGSWVLSIDADEIVSVDLAKEILNLKPSEEGYQFPFRNYLGNKWLKYGGLHPDYHLRLFKKELGMFKGIGGSQVHETVQLNSIGTLSGSVDHYTYASVKDFWHRVLKYSAQEGLSLSVTGNKPKLWEWIKIPLRFVKVYIFQFGFADGWYGFINALFLAIYQFRKVITWRRNIK